MCDFCVYSTSDSVDVHSCIVLCLEANVQQWFVRWDNVAIGSCVPIRYVQRCCEVDIPDVREEVLLLFVPGDDDDGGWLPDLFCVQEIVVGFNEHFT